MSSFILLLLLTFATARDFFVLQKYVEIKAQYGESAILQCSSNSPFEFCSWIHQNDVCEMEYKTRKNNVKLSKCNFVHRMTLRSNHSANICAIELRNVSGKDAGIWKCIMEEYKWAYDKGHTDTGEIHLVVEGIPASSKGTNYQ